MATEQDLEIIEDNDVIIVATIKVDGVAINLTGAEVEFFLKASKATEEDDISVIRYAIDTGEVTLRTQSGATLGQLEIRFNRDDIPAPVKKRYRLDVVQAERRLTYAYGAVRVKDV